MGQAPVEWASRIGAISDTFKNAVIDLLDPSLVTATYNVDTGLTTYVGDPVVRAGVRARVQPVRSSADIRGAGTGNPSGEVRVRVQLPRLPELGKIRRGWIVRVMSADRNLELDNYVLVVDSVVNSSWRASVTVECSVNVENESVWTP